MDRIAKKTRHFEAFVSDCYVRLDKLDIFKHTGNGRVNQLHGEQIELFKKSIAVLVKYRTKFLSDRMTDTESIMADKYDKESLGSSSYIKHMRPSMIKEFEEAYKMNVKLLKVDIFSLDSFPSIGNDGKIKYKKEQREEKEDECIDKEIVIMMGSPYAPCYRYIRESQQKKQFEVKYKNVDAWNLN